MYRPGTDRVRRFLFWLPPIYSVHTRLAVHPHTCGCARSASAPASAAMPLYTAPTRPASSLPTTAPVCRMRVCVARLMRSKEGPQRPRARSHGRCCLSAHGPGTLPLGGLRAAPVTRPPVHVCSASSPLALV